MSVPIHMNTCTWYHDIHGISIIALCSTDLTTYDAAKQAILRNTSLEDSAVTHTLSRWEFSVGDIAICTVWYHHDFFLSVIGIGTQSQFGIVFLAGTLFDISSFHSPLVGSVCCGGHWSQWRIGLGVLQVGAWVPVPLQDAIEWQWGTQNYYL